MEGGHLAVLIQPIEMLIIFGAAGGGLVTSSSAPLLKLIVAQVLGALKDKGVSKQEYMDLILCLYEVIKTAKANPMSLEAHVEKPDQSAIFSKYPSVVHNHHAIHFLCDTLKVQISSPMNPYDLEDLMNGDIKTMHDEELKAPASMAKTADAMPGLGIVAAVLGIVITMGKLSQGKEVIGHSVGAALVGTFLGVLLAYGFMSPLAVKMEAIVVEHGKLLDIIKVAVLAYAKDCSPKVCVEFARRTIPLDVRPDFDEVDKATSSLKAAA